MKNSIKIHHIVYTALMAAIIFAVVSLLSFPFMGTKLHPSNVFDLLAGLILGPWFGGLAAGIGNFLYDIVHGYGILEALVTFAMKFFAAMLAGLISGAYRKEGNMLKGSEHVRVILGCLAGLLGYLLPMFEEAYGYEVEVFSGGTKKAIENAKLGNADVIFVHAKAQEEQFVADGFAAVLDGMESERLTFMYNYFVLCGPSDDPAGVADAADVLTAFKNIADGKYTFISRGDGSGTHTKELSLWPEELGITDQPESFAQYADWYVSANAGMGACLVMAEEMHGYILTDKATFLTFVANDGVMD